MEGPREIVEGRTKILVPVEEKLSKKNPVFFNPEMELSRDISVAVAGISKIKKFCDLLAGSGARGIRISNEVSCDVIVNDVNSKAYDLIKRNIELNNLNARVTNLEANFLLSTERFDFIDIDPFGSPVRFLDSAIRAINNNGILGITATDTAALCGTYPNSCRRKYDAISLRTDYYNELGMRILIGYIARLTTKYDLSVIPLFSHCTRHYFRTYLKVIVSGGKAKNSLKNINFLQHCFKCLNRRVVSIDEIGEKCECGEKLRNSGPLWTGNFADPEFCKLLGEGLNAGIFNRKKEAVKLTGIIANEQAINNPYYNIHKLFRKIKKPAISMEDIIDMLNSAGFNAERTHFSGMGLRTDANASEIYKILKN